MNDMEIPAVLESTFALEQLTRIANDMDEHQFTLLFKPIFGVDVSESVYLDIWQALRDGMIEGPAYAVVERNEAFRAARYDSEQDTLLVNRDVIEQALNEPNTSPGLLLALIGGFGQYLADQIHSKCVAEGEIDSPELDLEDAKEAGSKYASLMAFLDSSPTDGLEFAHYTHDALSAPLVLDLSDTPELEEFLPEAPITIRPRFGAGEGGHGTIERVLEEVGFDETEIKSIYFGNWLRDHSQLVDPKLVRAEDAPRNFPNQFSRSALTAIVDILAAKEFRNQQDDGEEQGDFQVSPEVLGVYKASEHIDNPTNHDESPVDPTEIDPDFEKPVLPGTESTQVCPKTSMKAYIDKPVAHMSSKIREAAREGKTAEGMRAFGEALHVLEDYFAHSNFVELSLHKQGHTQVLPWTTEVECEHGLPVITGLFSGTDILGSLAEPLGKVLFPDEYPAFKEITPGYRSTSEQILLILLGELENPTWLKAFEKLLALRDRYADNPLFRFVRRATWTLLLPLNLVRYYGRKLFQDLFQWLGDRVGEEQTRSGMNPNTDARADATHSQLSKDHDSHPFYDLAIDMARHAVKQVGEEMFRFWNGEVEHPPADLASGFICHPYDSSWQDSLVAEWLEKHEDKVQAASAFDSLKAIYDKHIETLLEKLEALEVNSMQTT
ncbi:HET-C-related protein [Pseudomonas entomophila]|uniref:Heterokaryon incompatibility protein Het-C n=2 Tax=Pseudomonas entomophila TaxID=312306 RepID=Q1I5L6_PSEE4|nr:HET-C-related protein [Pseudomonas entomophila]WMW07204.1 HET-C-related protein [Pseudomonas entomophila]CAK17069.1 hypothetical protein PSEEN4384 [Pseudomonas entomophila L48]